MKIGGVGCISATGNVNPKEIISLYHNVDTPDAEQLQTRVSKIRSIVQSRPMIPALKAIISQAYEDPAWAHVKPPLTELPKPEAKGLLEELAGNAFSVDQLFASSIQQG